MNLRKRRRIRLACILTGLALIASVLLIRFRYEPALEELAVRQVQNVTAAIVNEAISDALGQGSISYNGLIMTEKTPDGRIAALTADMREVNRLKLEILDAIGERMSDVSAEALGVPLGSVVLPLLFSGKGPMVPIRYSAIRYSDASLENEFSQAGINQTLHRIILKVEISVTVMLPTGTKDVKTETNMVVAQTVIVGDVPQTVISMTGEKDGSER